jgi:hypothetical protein
LLSWGGSMSSAGFVRVKNMTFTLPPTPRKWKNSRSPLRTDDRLSDISSISGEDADFSDVNAEHVQRWLALTELSELVPGFESEGVSGTDLKTVSELGKINDDGKVIVPYDLRQRFRRLVKLFAQEVAEGFITDEPMLTHQITLFSLGGDSDDGNGNGGGGITDGGGLDGDSP